MSNPANARAGVIFDMDGLMLDSESIAEAAWQQAAAESGREMSRELFGTMIGRTRDDCAEILRAAYGDEFDFETVYHRCGAHYHEHITQHGIPLKPGVRELLEELRARRVPLGVATSTRSPVARVRLEQADLLGYFIVLVTGDEVKHGKPAPDIYLEAARRLGIDPAASYALEDSHAGVRAAHAAGFRVVMVPDMVAPTPEIAALAHRVAASLHEVRAGLHAWDPGGARTAQEKPSRP